MLRISIPVGTTPAEAVEGKWSYQEEFKVEKVERMEKGSGVCTVKELLGCARNSERQARIAPEQQQL